MTNELEFDTEPEDLEKTELWVFIRRLKKKPAKAKLIREIIRLSESKTKLGVKGITIMRLEALTKGKVTRWNMRNILRVLHREWNLITVKDNPFNKTRPKKIRKIVVKGKSKHLDYFKKELETIK